MKVLVAYATTEGQTRKISEHVAQYVKELGHDPEIVDTGRRRRQIHADEFDAFIVAASVHQDGHQEEISAFVTGARDVLNAKPSLFLSVSLSAAFDEGKAEAQGYIDRFIEESGWRPTKSLAVAGALRGDAYDYFQQQILQHVVLKGQETHDPGENHEFTDWQELERTVDEFLSQ
jgi:menaquinone-dependent protoporphyrinogen oxidase